MSRALLSALLVLVVLLMSGVSFAGDDSTADQVGSLATRIGLVQTPCQALAAAARLALTAEIEEALDQVGRLQIQLEKERARLRLTEVVLETRARAAAEEERDDRRQNKKAMDTLRAARFEVAREMIERGDIWNAIVGVYVREGSIKKNEASLVEESLRMAREALSRRDLSSVQRLVEASDAEARRLLSRFSEGTGVDSLGLKGSLLGELKASEARIVEEPFGITLGIRGAFFETNDNKESSPSLDEIRRFGAMLLSHEEVHCLVVARTKEGVNPEGSKKESELAALGVGDALTGSGLAPKRVHARGVGRSSPLKVFEDGEISVAMVLFTVKRVRR